jgi:hypothetical protein
VDKTKLDIQKDRLQIAEQFEATMKIFINGDQENLSARQKQEWAYEENLDRQRDHLRQLNKKIESSLDRHRQYIDGYTKSFHEDIQKAYLKQRTQAHTFYASKAKLAEQLQHFLDLHENLMHELKRVMQAIQSCHARLKEIAEKRGENKHMYFLNEHMIPLEMLSKFGIVPPSGSQIFTGTSTSACLPTAVRMIRADMDPSFAHKAEEVAAAFSTNGGGEAYISQVPEALQKLGHPIRYKTTQIEGVDQILTLVGYDKHGLSFPSIIDISRREKPRFPWHALICDKIIHINHHDYALLRDSSPAKAFAIRLEHLNEVLSDPTYISNLAYPIVSKN